MHKTPSFPPKQKIGETRGFNISGAVSSAPDRISAIAATFQLFDPTRPVDFDLRFDRPRSEKLEIRNKLVVAGAETVKASVNLEGDNDAGEASLSNVDIPCLFFDFWPFVIATLQNGKNVHSRL